MLPLIVLFLVLQSGANKIYPHILVKTDQECSTTLDCQSSNQWCLSGVTCLNDQCHRIPNHPCPYFQHCDEKSRQCLPIHCKRHSDCDDGIFCNGFESCVNGTCTSDFKHDCTAGQCDEKKKHCSLPVELQQKRGPSKPLQKKQTASSVGASGRLGALTTAPTSAPTAPTAAPTSSGLTNNAVIAIICATVVVAAVIFILLIIALISR